MQFNSQVSVIIPTYNRAQFLVRSLKSVLEQSLKDVEIIVIDDGSTDDTTAVIESFGQRINYIHTEHKGQAHARNVGMRAAKGKYIAFLDSDDTYLPFKLELQVSFMEKNPDVGMVFTEFSSDSVEGYFEEYHLRTYHDAWQNWRYEDVFFVKGEFMSSSVNNPVPCYIGNLFSYLLKAILVPGPTILFPRKILSVVGFQNEAYKRLEEYEFILRICKYFQVAFLNIPTYVHYYHDGQISVKPLENRLKREEILLKEVELYSMLLRSVMDWAYNDKEYYSKNKHIIDKRLAELHLKIGMKWLEYGDSEKARKYFRRSYDFKPLKKKCLKNLILSILPSIIIKMLFNYRIGKGKKELRLKLLALKKG